MRPISSHLDRKSLINKGPIIWLVKKFFLQDTGASPKWARYSSSILPTRLANHTTGFSSPCLLTELAIYIIIYVIKTFLMLLDKSCCGHFNCLNKISGQMKKIALWVIILYFPAKKGGMRLGNIQTDPFS